MTFVSYAQNFEDVMLRRALRDVEAGFYVDAGAAHPDVDSVTRAFYDAGWSGINVEPVAASHRRLQASRPRDVNVRAALGRERGAGRLFVVAGTGLSTLHEDAAARASAATGFAAEAAEVEVTTLADICDAHTGREIHFLKVDVEGAEADVLAGADFDRHRPWIVLVEATAPMSAEPTHAAWEPILLRAGYGFAYFDGLNRFYLADERRDALAPSFSLPPNVFDDFIRAADTEWARRVAEAEARAASAAREAAQARAAAEAAALEHARDAGQMRLALRSTERRTQAAEAHLAAENHARAVRLEAYRHHAQAAAELAQRMRASTSWRLTAPLRRAAMLVKGGAEGPPAAAPEPDRGPEPDPGPEAAAAPVVAPAGPRRLRRAVHQFHSGSATGDAITNAMLLTRKLLRARGYESEIYVEHLDPALADELLPFERLPTHDDHVLILHHSMGYDGFARIAALPAPKVLIYHNITSPELLDGIPELQAYARLGREQLARLRPLAAAALADSEYNVIELRRFGFDGARACNLLFDMEVMRERAAAADRRLVTDAFTILFVGRVAPSKGQRELIAAYAAFRQRFEKPSRLVLVGRAGDDEYVEGVRQAIRAAGSEAGVELAGLVSDEELHAWHSAADLYVSLSRHEGFGVPLVEAMAHGTPVLALPTGAVPYTLAGAGELIDDAEPGAVAERMLALADDPRRREAIAARQTASLDRFALERQVQTLQEALAAAGAAPPETPGLRVRLAENMRFTVAGHVNGSYSLASINRTLALAIEAERPGAVRLVAVEGAPTTDLSGVPSCVAGEAARLAARVHATGPEFLISQHYPVFVPDGGDVRAALFFWEESLVPADTVALLNRSFDGVLAAASFVAKALTDSGLSIPVRVVGHAPDLADFVSLRARRRNRVASEQFTFLHVSSGFPRKGVDALLAAWRRAFAEGDAVRLVIKLFPNPHNDAAEQIARLPPGGAEVALVDRDVEEAELLALYEQADCMVLPTRGEGFNIPAAEAMAAGVPLIVTGYGGHMDFCSAETARLVDYAFAPARTHLSQPHSVWAEPDADDLVAALREAVQDRQAAAARARRVLASVAAMADRGGFVRRVAAAGADLLMTTEAGPLRVGWVSTWNLRCGVAEYSRQLVEAMTEADPSLRVTVLCDHRTPGGESAWPAWEQGDAGSVKLLDEAAARLDPHVIVVQHQPGLLGWGVLADVLAQPALARVPVAVTLHNTRHLEEIGAEERARTLAALGGAARVLVHTVADLNLLKSLGLVYNVTLLPHGAPAPAAAARTPSRPDAPLLGSYGFFLPGKGIGTLIEVMARLRRSRPGARLRLVNAEYDTDESAAEIAACRAAAERLGVPVEWRTEFMPHARSLELLGECDVVALSYAASKEASSAALRTALAAGAVVATTPLPLFDEAGDAVFRFSGTCADAIAQGLEALLDDEELRARTRTAADAWLADRAWPVVGRRLAGMLTGLAADRRCRG
jgi:FkbM family methyltransferase